MRTADVVDKHVLESHVTLQHTVHDKSRRKKCYGKDDEAAILRNLQLHVLTELRRLQHNVAHIVQYHHKNSKLRAHIHRYQNKKSVTDVNTKCTRWSVSALVSC